MTRRALGRGLGALIPGAGAPDVHSGVTQIDVAQIAPNPFQPRREIAGPEFEELVASVRRHGVLQPIIARATGAGYEIVAGERRWRAVQAAGEQSIPAVVRDLSDREMLEYALVENLRREDLNAIERATAYKRLGEEFGLTQEEIAEVVGASRPSVANALRLLELPREVQSAITRGRISEGHGRALLSIQNTEALLAAWKVVEERELSVRETEDLAKASAVNVSRETSRRHAHAPNPQVADLARQVGERYSTTVSISGAGRKGTIRIGYYSENDLERLIDVLMR